MTKESDAMRACLLALLAVLATPAVAQTLDDSYGGCDRHNSKPSSPDSAPITYGGTFES
jgi:hypothetical protein